jgi:hypothetical protein
MIPTTYKTEAEALAIRQAYGEGSLLITSMFANGSTSTNPSLGGVLSADALARIQGTDLSGVTSTISTTVSGGFTSADAAYIDGMRTRLTDSITEFYASRPNLSPFNANNKQSGQSDANVRDNFLQVIFKYDARYGQRLRLSESEVITFNDTGSYQLPNRTAFIKNPWVEATMREHGASDINSIDDTGTGGAYRCTTATKHGLYDGMLISARPGATAPSPMTDTHVLRTVTKLTQDITSTSTAPTNSYYTTSANHNFVSGQKFVPVNVDLGIAGVDTDTRFWGFQRDRYIKSLSATTFELHRNYACTDRITVGFYNGSMNISQTGTGSYLVTGVTMQTMDGMPIVFDRVTGTNVSPSVFQQNIIASVDTSNGIWTTTGTILDGIQDGMLTNLNAFAGSTWVAMTDYDYPLYFKKLTNTSFTLHTSPTTLDSTTLWTPGTTSNQDLDSIEYTSSTWTGTWLRPHNLINGQDFRMRSVNSEFSGQEIDAYYYLGVNNAGNYWLLADTSDNIMDGSRISISSSTSTGAGTTFNIQSTEVTVPQNGLYVKRVGGAGNRKVQLFTDAAMTTQWTPLAAAGVEYAVEANTFLANIYFAKVINAYTVQLYSEATLTTKWNPNGGSTAVTEVTSGATGSTLHTEIVTTFNSPGTGYIQPMFFPETYGYTGVALYKDKALTIPYQLSDGGVVSGGGTSTITTNGCYRMNGISHYQAWVDSGESSNPAEITFSNSTMYPAYYLSKISDTVFDLYVDSSRTVPFTTPAIGTTGATSTNASMIAAVYQQSGGYRIDKIIGRNIGLLTYFYNNYDAGTTPVNAVRSYTWYPSHYESNGVHNYAAVNINWPDLRTAEYNNTNAGVYYGHLRPMKQGSSDAGNTGRLGEDPTVYGITQGSPMYYALNQPGRFNSSSPIILGIKVDGDVGTYSEDPLDFNGTPWDQGSGGQQYRNWPQSVQPTSLTWTIEQPTQVLETVNMNRYTRTRDVSQYRLKLTYPPMTSAEFQPFAALIHAARGAFKPFRYYMPRSNLIPMTISMQNKSTTMPANFFVRSDLTAGTRILEVDGLPPNKTESDPAMFAGCGCNMRKFNGMGSMMVPIHNVRTNEYGEANIRINNGIPSNIGIGNWMDSFIIYLDVFLDGNAIDIKVDTRGYHYLEVDMVTKRVF